MISRFLFVLSLCVVVSAYRIAQLRPYRVKIVRLGCTENDKKDDLMSDDKFKTFDMSSDKKPEGYLQADIKKMAEGQKSRVLAYIVLALVPVLFLVPFFLSRDFEPANF